LLRFTLQKVLVELIPLFAEEFSPQMENNTDKKEILCVNDSRGLVAALKKVLLPA
jgi:hypothetical protein